MRGDELKPPAGPAGSDLGATSVRAIDFHALFGVLPSPYMILDRDFRYVEVNQAYLDTVERSREDLIGNGLFEAFPSEGESQRLLRTSLERVLATGHRDTLALIPYPIERPASRGGGVEMRYWSATHVPLKDETGEVAYIVQNTVDVTELHRLKEIAYGAGEQALLKRAEEVQQANQILRQETTRLREMFMQAPGFMALLSGPSLTFTLVNHAYQQLIGHRPVIGVPLAEALPEVIEQGFMTLLHKVMAERQPFIGKAVSVRLQRTPHAPLEERFLDFIYQPILGPDGEPMAVFVEGADVTDRVRAEAQQKLLLDELNHRVKNTLATVQSIAAQTLRNNPDLPAFREAFESRILALSATHDILTASNWRSARLRDVLAVEFRPYGAERYAFDGPDVALAAGEALTLGLLFHELATNAAKYGALSRAEGCVKVRWRVEPGPTLALTWTEQGGPPVVPPSRRGFGSRLIERSLQGEMGGQAALDFCEQGLRCEIALPLRAAAEAAHGAS
jgi:two-component sensor histidine kinase